MCKQIDLEQDIMAVGSRSMLIEQEVTECELTPLQAEDYLFDLLRARAAIDIAVDIAVQELTKKIGANNATHH